MHLDVRANSSGVISGLPLVPAFDAKQSAGNYPPPPRKTQHTWIIRSNINRLVHFAHTTRFSWLAEKEGVLLKTAPRDCFLRGKNRAIKEADEIYAYIANSIKVFLGPRANAELVPKFHVALHASRAALQILTFQQFSP
jgi:hypothetical protein